MKELKDLAYTLERSGFEKQASRVYSLIKTAGNFTDMFKDSTPVGEGSKSQNSETKKFDTKIQNFSPWSNLKGSTKPAKMGPQAEKKIKENPAKYTNAVNNLKQIHPTSTNLQKIKFDGLNPEESNRRAFGSIAKMIKDTTSLANKDVPVEEVDSFATHINSLQPAVQSEPASPEPEPTLTSDSSFSDFENNAKEMDFGGQSDAIKEVFAQGFNRDVNQITIDQFLPEAVTFESGSIYDEDGQLKNKFSPASVSITTLRGDSLSDLFDGYIYGLWRGTRTLARLSTGAASSLIYAGTIVVKRGLTENETKALGKKLIERFKSAEDRLRDTNPDLANSFANKRKAAMYLAGGAEPTQNSNPPTSFANFKRINEIEKFAEDTAVIDEYQRMKQKLTEGVGKPYPVFFTNHKISPTLANIEIKNLKSENVNGKIDLRTGKPIGEGVMSDGSDSNLSTPLALIIYSKMADGKRFSGITMNKLRSTEDRNVKEKGGIFDVTDEKKAKNLEATIGEAIQQVETVFAQGGAGSRFGIDSRIISSVLGNINQVYRKEDGSFPRRYPMLEYNIETRVDDPDSKKIINDLFIGTRQKLIEPGGLFTIGQVLGPLYHDGSKPILDLSKIKVESDPNSIRIFNSILLSEAGAENYINDRFIYYLKENMNKANFQPVNVAIGQAMRLTLLYYKSKKLLDTRSFDPLRKALLYYIQSYMKDAVDKAAFYVTQYKPKQKSRTVSDRTMREQLE